MNLNLYKTLTYLFTFLIGLLIGNTNHKQYKYIIRNILIVLVICINMFVIPFAFQDNSKYKKIENFFYHKQEFKYKGLTNKELFTTLINEWNDSSFGKVLDNFEISERYGRYKTTKGVIGVRHLGTDFEAKLGSNVYAPSNCYVLKVGRYGDEFVSGGGNQVHLITKVNGKVYGLTFMHLREITCDTGVVLKGNILGTVGMTGNADSPHCHIELYELGEGNLSDYIKEYDYSFDVKRELYAKGRLNPEEYLCNLKN